MDVLLFAAQLVIGGFLLYLGAEWMVDGSAGLARAFGVKPLVVGLTVVAYGTSAPELAVSSVAILDYKDGLVLGNVFGSCVANLALILGVTALIAPPAVDGRLIRREVPVLITSVIAAPLVLIDGVIAPWEAGLLLACAVAFTIVTLVMAAKDRESTISAEADDEDYEGSSKTKLGLITLVGLALLVGGGKVFVDGATGVAKLLGMGDELIGATVVAIGTSLPELAASVVAALRGQSELAVGNVIGSNIFNIFLIFGAVGLIRPIEGEVAAFAPQLWFLGGVTLLGVLFMRGDRRVSRLEGTILLLAYLAFIAVMTAMAMGWM